MQMSDVETIEYAMAEEEVNSLAPSSSHTTAPEPSPPPRPPPPARRFHPTGAAGVGDATREEGVGERPHPQHQQPLEGGPAR